MKKIIVQLVPKGRLFIRRLFSWMVIVQLLWGTVYAPVRAQVPPSGENAGDWMIYRRSANADQEGFINLLVILDSSDSMNQPESWRPYPGSYNSHVEYLWNDPLYIGKIATDNPPVPDQNSFSAEQVRIGYFTYHLSSADKTLTDENEQNNRRAQLRTAALNDANTPIRIYINSYSASNMPKWLYRNYGGPTEFSFAHFNTTRWFNANWIYFVPSGLGVNVTNIHQSPYLLSTSFSRFFGANDQDDRVRASIPYKGQLSHFELSFIGDSPQFTKHNRYDDMSYERFNVCHKSRYDANKSSFTGLGKVAYGIKPSTVYNPGFSEFYLKKSNNGPQRDVVSDPIVGFNTGYYKRINYIRLDPYAKSTMTRDQFINEYPGARQFDDPNYNDNTSPTLEVWPPDQSDFNYYHNGSGNMNFSPAYLDMRCWKSTAFSAYTRKTPSLDTSLYLNGAGAGRFCRYEFKSSPRRDNFVAARVPRDNDPRIFGGVNGDGTSALADRFGMHGLPIRLLRYRLTPYTGDDTSTPSTRWLQTSFGGCADGSGLGTNDVGPGGYRDWKCNARGDLKSTWSDIRSDNGGFNHAFALYDLYANLKKPKTDNSGNENMNTNDRLGIINTMLDAYSIGKFDNTTSYRFKYSNNGGSITPNGASEAMFAAYLGNRDCLDYGTTNLVHCQLSLYSSSPAASNNVLVTGVSGYADYTRSTYNFCIKRDGTKGLAEDGDCWYKSTEGLATSPRDGNSGYQQMNTATPTGSSTWSNGVTSFPSVAFTAGPWPGSGGSWEYRKHDNTLISNARQVDISPDAGKNYLVIFAQNSRMDGNIFKAAGGATTCLATPPTTSRLSVDNGTTWVSATPSAPNPRVIVGTSSTVRLSPTTTGIGGSWYWIGDGNFNKTTTQDINVTFSDDDAGKIYEYNAYYFDGNGCIYPTRHTISLEKYEPLKVRSNTYKVYDTNIGGTIDSANNTIRQNIMGDNADSLGMIAPNASGDTRDLYQAFGAVEIRKTGANSIPSDFKQYRRFVNCSVDRSGMKWVFADDPGNNSNTNFYFTHPTCSRKNASGTAYDATQDCQVQTGGTGAWVAEADQSKCAGLQEPSCGFSPVNYVYGANWYRYQGCSFLGITDTYEGNSVTMQGKSCGLAVDGTHYVIDWDNPINDAPTSLTNQYTGRNYSGFGYSAGALPTSFKNIGELKGNCAPYYSGTYNPAGRLPNATQTRACQMSSSPNTNGPAAPTRVFSPVYYSQTGSNYTLYNAQPGANCSSLVPSYSFSSITGQTWATANTNYLYVNIPVSGGFCSGTSSENDAKTVTDANSSVNVGACQANLFYSDGYRSAHREDALPSSDEANFRLFQAFNVLRHGARNYQLNSALSNPASGMGYVPFFVHACTNDVQGFYDSAPDTLGLNSEIPWLDSSTSGSGERRQFGGYDKTMKLLFEDKRGWIYPGQHLETNTPFARDYDFVFKGSKVSQSNTPGSQIDLYSVNYLNFIFGPKYNDSPIGRRTRFQLAQDTLAEFISQTPARVRIGLMFFNRPAVSGDWGGKTNGGYVAKRIARLEAKVCPTVTTNFTISNDGQTLTSDVDSWFERVPKPSGGAAIPENVRTNLVTGGTVSFVENGVTYAIKTSAIDDNGTITLDTPAPPSLRGTTQSLTMENCNIANYPALTGHRADLIKTLYSKIATSQTPLTETLYEAYLYFHGGPAYFGKYTTDTGTSDGSSEADITNYGGNEQNGVFTDGSYSTYLSPMRTVTGQDSSLDYTSCSLNNILLITDGYANGDYNANQKINNLPTSNGVSANLTNDTSGKILSTQIVSPAILSESGSFNPAQFKDLSTNLPFGPVDQRNASTNSYILFDELAYYLGNANISPTSGVNGNHPVKLWTAALDINCSPVISNAIKMNRNGQCAEIDSGTDDLEKLLANLLNQLNQWVPSVNIVAVPLPASNRSSSSVDSYMGMFSPDSGLRVWRGNMKKYQLAFGPVDCGTDINGKPIDVCITGKNVLAEYSLGTTTIKSRNIMSRADTAFDITIAGSALDYWSRNTSSDTEGNNVLAGGAVSQIKASTPPDPNGTSNKVYTFKLPIDTNGAINYDSTAVADITATANNVNISNLSDYKMFGTQSTPSYFEVMPSTANALPSVIKFMLGQDPETNANIAFQVRSEMHGDVMHSQPAVVNYLIGGVKTNVVYYLTGNGDLIAAKDDPTNQASDSGTPLWRFYPLESLRRQYEIMKNFNNGNADTKIFGADGSVSTLYFDKNQDGFINPGDGDKVFIAFGLRRGGRAVYMLDVTDREKPKIQWVMSNLGICHHNANGNFNCYAKSNTNFASANGLNSNYSGSTTNFPAEFFDELGYTWSAPLMGFVNRKADTTGAFDGIYTIKRSRSGTVPTPVVIFGGGYDPQEDYQIPDRTKVSMGRGLYVMEALTGLPIKFWYRSSSAIAPASANKNTGVMIRNVSGNYTAPNCRSDENLTNNPFDYPIISAVYGMNVDYDSANTIDRLYVGDTGGQMFRFDVGDPGDATDKGDRFWRGTLMGQFNDQVTWGRQASSSTLFNNEFYIKDANNKQTVNGRELYRRARKFFQPPLVATWSRYDSITNPTKSQDFNYIYALTGDIDHPWSSDTQDVALALVDPEVNLKMTCAPVNVAKIGNVRDPSSSSWNIHNLVDITNFGRVDVNSDDIIDKNDMKTAAQSAGDSFAATREQLSLIPDYQYRVPSKSTFSNTNGVMGWFYRMERGEKAVSQPRVIDSQLTWTAFASLFSQAVCSAGMGTKYYLHAYWGHTVDTNNDGKASNCLTAADQSATLSTSLLKDPTSGSSGAAGGSGYVSSATTAENRLRTPMNPATGTTPGRTSLSCDSPRPIYNTSYGLLSNDIQVARDGVLYRVGLSTIGNQRGLVYDDQGTFLGNDYSKSLSESDKTALASTATGAQGQLLKNDGGTARDIGSTIANSTNANAAGGTSAGDKSKNTNAVVGSGAQSGVVRPPGQLYWYRDDIR